MADPTLLDTGVFLAVATHHGSALSLSGGEEEGEKKKEKISG